MNKYEKTLPCAVVRDLLPSYAEGLTEEETNIMVAEHLHSCVDCAERYAAMKAPTEEPVRETTKEVDYLKTVRRKNHKKMVLAVAAALLIVALGAAVKLFVIGSPAFDAVKRTYLTYEPDETRLVLKIDAPYSAKAYTGLNQLQKDGIVTFKTREVLVSPLYGSGTIVGSVNLDGVREVYFFDELIWKDGLIVPEESRAMLEKRTPYVGDAPALSDLDQTLMKYGYLPDIPHTMELQTSAEPYGWTLHFDDPMNWEEEKLMKKGAYLMLALVDNLGEVRWTAPGPENTTIKGMLSLKEANAQLPKMTEMYNAAHAAEWTAKNSVKDYTEDAYTLRQLWSIVWQ